MVKIIEILKAEGTQPPLVLWALSKEVNNLERKVNGVYGNIDDSDDDDEDYDEPLVIGDDVNLDFSDINNLNHQKLDLEPISLDIETL